MNLMPSIPKPSRLFPSDICVRLGHAIDRISRSSGNARAFNGHLSPSMMASWNQPTGSSARRARHATQDEDEEHPIDTEPSEMAHNGTVGVPNHPTTRRATGLVAAIAHGVDSMVAVLSCRSNDPELL